MEKALETGQERKIKHSFHFISETLTKDIRFVSGCLRKAISSVVDVVGADVDGRRRRLKVWVDAGTHFRNGYMLESIFGDSSTSLCRVFCPSLNFFAEGHGKGECDGEFGVLTNAVKTHSVSIRTIEELKAFFDVHCTRPRQARKGWELRRHFEMFVSFPSLLFSSLHHPFFSLVAGARRLLFARPER